MSTSSSNEDVPLALTLKKLKRDDGKRKANAEISDTKKAKVDVTCEGTSKARSKNLVATQKKQPSVADEVAFETSMSPLKLIKFLRRLNVSQRSGVHEIGLGFIFNLQITMATKSLCHWLVQKYNPESCCFELRGGLTTLHVQPIDVRLTLGLPIGGTPITLKSRAKAFDDKIWENTRKQCIKDIRLGEKWPTMTQLGDAIIEHKDGSSDAFKRLFCLYFVAAFIDGPTGFRTPQTFIGNISDVNRIKELDWCRFVFERLNESVRLFKIENAAIFSGPIVFLMLFYVNRMQYLGEEHRRDFPIISCWSKEQFKRRIDRELQGSGFGNGSVLDRIILEETPATTKETIDLEFLRKMYCHFILKMEKNSEYKNLKKKIARFVTYGSFSRDAIPISRGKR